jgi:hypothetical protein
MLTRGDGAGSRKGRRAPSDRPICARLGTATTRSMSAPIEAYACTANADTCHSE